MFKPVSMVEGKSIASPEEDFRRARRVEQYRISDRALYIPNGLRWSYIPLDEIREAEPSHRVVSAGKCVAVTEKRPTLSVKTQAGSFRFPLERQESLTLLLKVIRGDG